MVREATPEDAEAIDRVIQETWIDAYTGVEPEEKLAEIREMDEVMPHDDLKGWIKSDSSIYLVAEEGDEIIGEAIIMLEGNEDFMDYTEERFLYSLYVLPEYQGKGAGTALLQKSEEVLFEEVEKLKTMVIGENSQAINFYRKRGFEKCGETGFGGGEESLLAKEHQTLILEKLIQDE
ncbi:MAG: N-acetyltransferase family protein [Candidatus Nanohalobium sp.]